MSLDIYNNLVVGVPLNNLVKDDKTKKDQKPYYDQFGNKVPNKFNHIFIRYLTLNNGKDIKVMEEVDVYGEDEKKIKIPIDVGEFRYNIYGVDDEDECPEYATIFSTIPEDCDIDSICVGKKIKGTSDISDILSISQKEFNEIKDQVFNSINEYFGYNGEIKIMSVPELSY